MPSRIVRSFPSRLPRGGVRRQSLWIGFGSNQVTLTSLGGTITHALNAAALALRPFTIVRTLFVFDLRSDQAAAVEQQAANFGIAVVSDQALAVGITAVPTPVTDIGSDLFFAFIAMYADESSLTDRTRGSSKYLLDSKAMRKVPDDADLAVVAEADTAVAAGCILRMTGRMLVKLN